LEQIGHQLGARNAYDLSGVSGATGFSSLSNEQQARLMEVRYYYDLGWTQVDIIATIGEYVPPPADVYAITASSFDQFSKTDLAAGNRLGFLGALGNVFSAGADRYRHDGFLDTLGDAASNFLHGAGEVLDRLGKALLGGLDALSSGLDRLLGFEPGVRRTGKPEPTSDYSASSSNKALADKNGDGHLDDREQDHFRDLEEDRFDKQRAAEKDGKEHGATKPILLDLDGNGVKIDELSRSTTFVDADGDGLKHRTAWAGAGDGVLFFDADGDGTLSERREYVFTEWDPTASSDMEALRSYFDTNGDGKLTAADAGFAQFRVLVTNADGTKTARSLAELGITEINLTEDATRIVLPDGSVIEGQTTFTKSDGSTGTVASTALVAEAEGHRVTEVVSTDGNGNRVVVSTAYGAGGQVLYAVTSVTSPTGASVTNSWDDDGDGVTDRIQTIDTVTNGDGSTTETIVNKVGALAATAITVSRTVTTRSADGASVVIERDSTGGGWFDQREVQVIQADGSRTNTTSDRCWQARSSTRQATA
jgi:hypothetical protein